MARFVCPECGYKYWVHMEGRCTACGYFFDYARRKEQLSIPDMKAAGETIPIRGCLCALLPGESVKTGYHAHAQVTNKGLRLEVFEKFDCGTFVNKKGTYAQNPQLDIPFAEILRVYPGTYQGKTAVYFLYETKSYGTLRLYFGCDGAIADKHPDIDDEMARLIGQFL